MMSFFRYEWNVPNNKKTNMIRIIDLRPSLTPTFCILHAQIEASTCCIGRSSILFI